MFLSSVNRTFFTGKLILILILSGAHLMFLNFIMVQQLSFAIRKPFIAVILYTLSYFLSISIGYAFSDKLSHKNIYYLLPLLMITQMTMLIFIQPIAYALSQTFGSLSMYIILSTIFIASSASFGSLFLPRIIDEDKIPILNAYRFEITGALIALILILLLGQIGYHWIINVYLITWILFCLLLKTPRMLTSFVVITTLIFGFNFNSWDLYAAKHFYKSYYKKRDIRDIIYRKYSIYQKVEIAETNSGEKILLLNGRRQFTEGSFNTYSYFVALLPSLLLEKPHVAVLGCGSMSTVGRVGDKAKKIEIVDIDEEVFKASERYFKAFNRLSEFKNWTFVADDAKHFLGSRRDHFDLILHDIPPAKSRQTALTYTKEFFELVKSRLSDEGIFSISSLTPLHENSDYGKNMLSTLTHVFEHYFAIEYRGDIYFYGGKKSMPLPTKQQLEEILKSGEKKDAVIYLGKELKPLITGGKIITLNNLSDLIYE